MSWQKGEGVRRFDEIPPAADWVPVSTVIKSYRAHAAREQAQEVKARPPLDTNFTDEEGEFSASSAVPQAEYKAPTSKKDARTKVKRKSDKTPSSRETGNRMQSSFESSSLHPAAGSASGPTVHRVEKMVARPPTPPQNDHRKEQYVSTGTSDINAAIDGVTQAMIDWALKTDLGYSSRHRQSPSHHSPSPEPPNLDSLETSRSRHQHQRKSSPRPLHSELRPLPREPSPDYDDFDDEDWEQQRQARDRPRRPRAPRSPSPTHYASPRPPRGSGKIHSGQHSPTPYYEDYGSLHLDERIPSRSREAHHQEHRAGHRRHHHDANHYDHYDVLY